MTNCCIIYNHILPKAFKEMNVEPDKKIVFFLYTRETKRQYCLSNIGVKVWNSLNENMKYCDNLNSFNRSLMDHIINLN